LPSDKDILNSARNTLLLESKSIEQLIPQINQDFVDAVRKILASNGRLVVTGIGKSAIIAQKIVATFNSTGTPALFMHAADAIHGDLGMILRGDIVMCISNSGNTPEIKALLPLLKGAENTVIGLTGNSNSVLAKASNHLLQAAVEREACPNNLAPTTSTTAQLALGDALAVALIEARGFKPEDFAQYHPGGSLGKRLYLSLADLAKNNSKPTVKESATLRDCIVAITAGRLGVAIVLDDNNLVVGIITDGDLRRMLSKTEDLQNLKAQDIMTKHPKTLGEEELAVKGAAFIKENNVNHIVLTNNRELTGIVHIQDLVREGLL
jgi:arabinose-5-phosphate isomerase